MPFNPFSALTSKIYGALAIAGLAGAGVQTVRIEGVWCRDAKLGEKSVCMLTGWRQSVADLKIDLGAVRAERDAEAEAHRHTKESYRQAQLKAAELEKQRIARVMAQQEEATDAIAQDYSRRLAALRARAQQLRPQGEVARIAAAGAGGEGAVPGLSAAAGRTAAGAGDPRLSRSVDEQLARDLIASEQAEQLVALQDFVRAQAAIDPNPAILPEN